MKPIFSLMLLHWFTACISQTPIPSYPLSVGCRMTTNIIFPYRIEKADIGSVEVIGQIAGRLGNVLFLKGQRKGFSTTNLSVYTADGRFYSFLISYKEYPDTLNISFANPLHSSLFPDSVITEENLDSDAVIIKAERSYLNKRVRSEQITGELQGIYLKDQRCWLRLEIRNGSDIDFEPEFIKCSIRYKKRSRRTAVQEIPMKPVWEQHQKIISGQSRDTLLFAFPSFSFNRQKTLIILVTEKNGDREMRLSVSAKTLLQARKVKE